MTSLLHDQIRPDEIVDNSWLYEQNDQFELDRTDSDGTEATTLSRTKLAKNAVTRFFDWISTSPNNPTYKESPTFLNRHDWLVDNASALQGDIETRLADLSDSNMPADMARLYNLQYGPQEMQTNWKGEQVPVPRMFEALALAYAGIEDIVNRSRDHRQLDNDAPLESFRNASEDIVQAIGATFVRAHYFELIAERDSEVLPKDMLDGMKSMYKQNITAEIQRAGLLQRQLSELPAPASATVLSLPQTGGHKNAA